MCRFDIRELRSLDRKLEAAKREIEDLTRKLDATCRAATLCLANADYFYRELTTRDG